MNYDIKRLKKIEPVEPQSFEELYRIVENFAQYMCYLRIEKMHLIREHPSFEEFRYLDASMERLHEFSDRVANDMSNELDNLRHEEEEN